MASESYSRSGSYGYRYGRLRYRCGAAYAAGASSGYAYGRGGRGAFWFANSHHELRPD
jgi:hypothetical protein